MAVWVDIKGYNGEYQISDTGKVRSLKYAKTRILKTSLTYDGYKFTSLTIRNKKKTARIHRLIAEAFIENPNNLPLVNHKNKNKTDNRIENLEWVSAQQNIIHARTHANKVMLGSKKGNFASRLIPEIVKAVPFKEREKRVKSTLGEMYAKHPVPEGHVYDKGFERYSAFIPGGVAPPLMFASKKPSFKNGSFARFTVFDKEPINFKSR